MSDRDDNPRQYYVVHVPEAAFVFDTYEQALAFARERNMDQSRIKIEQMSPSYVAEIPEYPN